MSDARRVLAIPGRWLVAVAVAVALVLGSPLAFPAAAQVADEPAPSSLALDGWGHLYVTDYANDRVLVLNTFDGSVVHYWGTRGAEPGQFDGPFGIAVDPVSGAVYVVDQLNNRIQKFSAGGALLQVWGAGGMGLGELRTPFGVVALPSSVYVADFGNDRVQEFSANGHFIRTWGTRGAQPGQFSRPLGLAIGADGAVYVSDHFNNRVQKFSATGEFLLEIGSVLPGMAEVSLAMLEDVVLPDEQLLRPEELALDRQGNLYVADYGRNRVAKFDPDGHFLGAWGGLGSGHGQMQEPKGITVDQETGQVYVADTGNSRIQRFAEDGTWEATWQLLP